MIGRHGLAYKVDATTGLIAYSTRSGLFFGVSPEYAETTERWLDERDAAADTQVRKVLEASQSEHPQAEVISSGPLLPSADAWTSVATPSTPIAINWLLTPSCPLRCMYCYAEDLMRETREPDSTAIRAAAEHILSFNPVVVVLTGGDPLASPHLELAVQQLSGSCAIVVDTNGLDLTKQHIELFRQHDVALRVSLDSEVPVVSRRQRPTRGGQDSSTAAVAAICAGVDAGLTVAVQTVATRWNVPDLAYLGDKLYRMGVRLWRVFEVAPSRDRMEGYLLAAGATSARKRMLDGMWSHFVEDTLGTRSRLWADSMAVQLTPSTTRNSVILVGPDGTFYTESTSRVEKVVIDDHSPERPSLEALHARVDMSGHLRRYLGSRPGEDSYDL